MAWLPWRMCLVLAVLGLAATAACRPPAPKYQCRGGEIVSDPAQCPELQNLPRPPPADATAPEPPATNATQANESAGAPPSPANATPPGTNASQGQLYVSLNGWSIPEILQGMSKYNADVKFASFAQVVYDKPNSPEYRVGKNQVYRDPFYVLRSPFSGRSKEDPSFHHLRIEVPKNPSEYLAFVDQKHNDSKFKLVYPEQWAEFDKIRCAAEASCRQIEAVRCTHADNRTLFIWTHNASAVGYTSDTKYTMMSQDDGRTLLTSFEKFYCTPI